LWPHGPGTLHLTKVARGTGKWHTHGRYVYTGDEAAREQDERLIPSALKALGAIQEGFAQKEDPWTRERH
jgi:hypothetical protein